MKLIILLVIIFSGNIVAQDFSEIEIQEFDGQLLNTDADCLDTYNGNKGRKLLRGRNQRGNNWFFIGVGQADISAPIDNPNYVNSVQNAFTLASLRAKREMAEFLSKEIEDEIIATTIEAIKTGKKPTAVAKERADLKDRRAKYEASGIIEKAFMLAHQKLDEMIGEELNIEQAENALQSRLDRILAQDTFKRITTTTAYSEIRGMKNLFIRVSETNACVVSVFSSKTRLWADAIATEEYEIIRSLANGRKTMDEVIPDKRNSNGLRKLLGSFGTMVDVDRNGDIYIVSFAQAGAIDSSADRLNSARKIAQVQAKAQIIQFLNEAVDVYSRLEQIEITTTNVDETKDYYSERDFLDRLSASSKANLKGLQVHSWWAANHPYTKKPVVGTVVTWTPSAVDFVEEMNNENEYTDF